MDIRLSNYLYNLLKQIKTAQVMWTYPTLCFNQLCEGYYRGHLTSTVHTALLVENADALSTNASSLVPKLCQIIEIGHIVVINDLKYVCFK